jgi:hypothetical protein
MQLQPNKIRILAKWKKGWNVGTETGKAESGVRN